MVLPSVGCQLSRVAMSGAPAGGLPGAEQGPWVWKDEQPAEGDRGGVYLPCLPTATRQRTAPCGALLEPASDALARTRCEGRRRYAEDFLTAVAGVWEKLRNAHPST